MQVSTWLLSNSVIASQLDDSSCRVVVTHSLPYTGVSVHQFMLSEMSQVAKNRFDGELGIMLLKFDKDTLSFAVKLANKDARSTTSTPS